MSKYFFDPDGNFVLTPESFLWLRVGTEENIPNIGVWGGEIYNVKDGQRYLLSNFVGMCVAIRYRRDSQLMLLVKEALVWTDENHNPVSEVWDELQGCNIKVVHVKNEPAVRCPITQKSLDNFVLNQRDKSLELVMRFSLDYPNPISVKDYPKWSSYGNYKAVEEFQFNIDSEMYSRPRPKVNFKWIRNSIPYPFMLTGPNHDYTQSMLSEGELGIRILKDINLKMVLAVQTVFPTFDLQIPQSYKDDMRSCQSTWTNIADMLQNQQLW